MCHGFVGWTKERIWTCHFGLAEIEMTIFTISWHFTGCVHVCIAPVHTYHVCVCVCVCVCPTSLPWPSCLTHRRDTHTPGCPVGRWKVSCPRSLHHLLLLTPDLPSQWGQPTNTPSNPHKPLCFFLPLSYVLIRTFGVDILFYSRSLLII